jgi:hypothetical protein
MADGRRLPGGRDGLHRRRHPARQTRRAQACGRASVGFALLAGVTLDGLPENFAMGVGLIESGSTALLVAIFVSNLPEAIVGPEKMREAGGIEPARTKQAQPGCVDSAAARASGSTPRNSVVCRMQDPTVRGESGHR